MPLPKLSPLQSRLAASLIASITLLILYFAFASPHFAYAADVDSIRQEDHNHERLLAGPFLDLDYDELELREVSYEPEFLGVDRGITPRATDLPVALVNNRQDPTNIQLGQTVYYMFSNTSLWADPSPPTPGLPSQITLNGRTMMEMDSGDDTGADELKLKSRQTTGTANRTVYITVTACDQPSPISNTTTDPPPQLQLYVSQSADNTNPGPTSNSDLQDMVALVGGYALYTVNATGNVFIGVYGVNNSAYSGVWSAQIAASIDAPYHYYWNSSDPNLFLVDSDTEAAFFYTDSFITIDSTKNGSKKTGSNKRDLNTTLFNEWMSTAPPFVMFANDASNTAINGIQNSYCGLQNHASISQVERSGQTTSQVVTEMTSIGDPALPKQQFYINGLSPGTSYNVILAMNGNSTDSGDGVVGGGGQVFHMANFTTATDANCQVIFDLSFCTETAYAVPANPKNFNLSSLAAFYDNSAQQSYGFFQNALAQTPCNTTSSAQYTLTRTCTDCENAYKQWLCSVTIPRCADFNSPLPWLQQRAMGQPFLNGSFLDPATVAYANTSMPINGSRNPLIDQQVIPGPYKEVLPCDDLCFNLMRSCPAAMGFWCPMPGSHGFNTSYGTTPNEKGDDNGRIMNITCNYPGVAYYLAAGGRTMPSLMFVLMMAAMGFVMLV